MSEVVECWGFFAFFFLAEKIQRLLGGCSLLRESFKLGWLLDCSSGGKEEEELVFGFLLLLLLFSSSSCERTPLVTNLFVAVEIAGGLTRPEQRLLSLLLQQLCIF